jgi:hypothetical protein
MGSRRVQRYNIIMTVSLKSYDDDRRRYLIHASLPIHPPQYIVV